MRLWPTTTKNKCFVKILWHLLGKCVKVIVLSGLFNVYYSSFFCALFKNIYLYEIAYIYIYIYIFYTDTTNFIIFSQWLRCQFLIGRNKIIKYETVTNHK